LRAGKPFAVQGTFTARSVFTASSNVIIFCTALILFCLPCCSIVQKLLKKESLEGTMHICHAASHSGHQHLHHQKERGRHARRPGDIPPLGWLDILRRAGICFFHDSVMLVAAGVAFYVLLALFPALLAFVSLYGFVADPAAIASHLTSLDGVFPASGLELIRQQLGALVSQNSSSLSLGFVLGLSFSLWTANSGVKAMFEAMNIAYDEREKRSFLHINALSAVFTFGSAFLVLAFFFLVGVAPVLLAYNPVQTWNGIVLEMLRWALLAVTVGGSICCLYRYGPSREAAKWRWLSIGAGAATLAWIAASLAFSAYLANFANYNATYGSLGAFIGFMVWIWISAVIVISGALLNAQIEYQIFTDSTTGEPLPLGQRGAVAADNVAR
jgi:membrane protein